MRRLILAVFMVLALAMPAFAQISDIHNIHVRGSEYNVTDVRSHSHKYKIVGEKSLILNTVVINKEGQQIEGYPLTVKVSELDKAELKTIPDNRPLQYRRPFVHFILVQGPNLLFSIWSAVQ